MTTATPPTITANSGAGVIARLLKRRGVTRIFALCGGHIMPIWMRLDAEGIRIIDVRDERAAVHMAHAHAELTGRLGVAITTARPGVTNTITAIANALARPRAGADPVRNAATVPGESRCTAGHEPRRVRTAAYPPRENDP